MIKDRWANSIVIFGDCPICKAPKGEPCRTPKGRIKYDSVHNLRPFGLLPTKAELEQVKAGIK